MDSTPPPYLATLARKRMGSAVLLTDSGNRVLLVEPAYKPNWELPGGAVEADESPYAAAVRELREELGDEFGATRAPGRLLVVDWVPPRPGRTEGVMFVYDGGQLDGSATAVIRPAPDELRGWEWCEPAQVRRRMLTLLARRVEAALRARAEGTTAYLEAGRRVV